MKIVEPHKKISRDVEPEEYGQVLKLRDGMLKFCARGNGIHRGGYALAHPQVDDKDPMRFFVLRNGIVIINPKIVRHTRHTQTKQEGCLSYPTKTPTSVGRYTKCEAEYVELIGEEVHEVKRTLTGIEAQIFQHEIDHMDGIDIFNK